MLDEFRENGFFKITHNKYGYAAFDKEITDFDELKK